METRQIKRAATLIVIVTGALWGFYWIPVRQLTQLGLTGAWGTLAITLCAVVVLLPYGVAQRHDLLAAQKRTLISIALGGAAFALYSIGFVYGRVAIIILLYFLTPVWSTLIARYVFKWSSSPLRIAAIIVGLIGLGVMLGADGAVPIPRGIGEWMALCAGLLWSVSTTGIRTSAPMSPLLAALVFAMGAALISLILTPFLDPWSGQIAPGAMWVAFLAGLFWWAASVAGLMWAAARLEPARVGILLMAEVLVGAASAAYFAGEHLAPLELIGGALVLLAGMLEVWPQRSDPADQRAA